MPPAGDPHSRDGTDRVGTLFAVLADEHRRQVLHRLQAAPDDAVPVERLVADLAERTEASGDRGRIAVRLEHVTLPALVDAGIVEYDRRSGAVRYRGDPVLERLLRRIRRLAAAP